MTKGAFQELLFEVKSSFPESRTTDLKLNGLGLFNVEEAQNIRIRDTNYLLF